MQTCVDTSSRNDLEQIQPPIMPTQVFMLQLRLICGAELWNFGLTNDNCWCCTYTALLNSYLQGEEMETTLLHCVLES